LGRLASYVRDRRTCLEMCPTSNVQTGAAPSIEARPIGLPRQMSFRVTVNTDNRLMSGVTLSSEFAALVDAFGYGWSGTECRTSNGRKMAFAHFDERLQIINTVIKPGFATARAASDAVVRVQGRREEAVTTKGQPGVADGPATGPAPGAALAGSMEAAMARRWPSDVGTSDSGLRQFLHGLPGVDTVGAQQRAAGLATRSIKRDAKLWALDMAVRMVDLTTLEGADTPGKAGGLCAKARPPDPADPDVPPVAAVCVYPDLVGVARAGVAGSTVAVASVATAF